MRIKNIATLEESYGQNLMGTRMTRIERIKTDDAHCVSMD